MVISASARASWAAPHRLRRDYQMQMALREAALTLKDRVPEDGVVLVQWRGMRKSHLYVKYWSRRESFELVPGQSAWDRASLFREAPSIYVLTDAPLADPMAQQSGPGYLFSLR